MLGTLDDHAKTRPRMCEKHYRIERMDDNVPRGVFRRCSSVPCGSRRTPTAHRPTCHARPDAPLVWIPSRCGLTGPAARDDRPRGARRRRDDAQGVWPRAKAQAPSCPYQSCVGLGPLRCQTPAWRSRLGACAGMDQREPAAANPMRPDAPATPANGTKAEWRRSQTRSRSRQSARPRPAPPHPGGAARGRQRRARGCRRG